jgi:hypothetical protein
MLLMLLQNTTCEPLCENVVVHQTQKGFVFLFGNPVFAYPTAEARQIPVGGGHTPTVQISAEIK